MTTIPLVRACAILPFVKFLNKIGSPTERFLEQSYIPICTLDNPENLMPLNLSFSFVEAAARQEGIDSLGLLVAQETHLSDLGIFGLLVCQSLTLHELLHNIMKLHNRLVTGENIWLTEESSHVWFHQQYTVPSHIPTRQGQGYTVLMYLNAILLAAGSDWQPDRLHLQGNINKAFLDLDCLSRTQIQFNQPTNAIRFSKDLLSKPLNHSQPSLHSCDLEAALELTTPPTHFIDSLRQLISLLLPGGYPGLPVVAESAGMSIRTFQRRLEENNINFSQLIEQVRFKQAVHLLQDSTHQLIDIALELGYTDAANFTRAFKRWTGISPREFRRLYVNA